MNVTNLLGVGFLALALLTGRVTVWENLGIALVLYVFQQWMFMSTHIYLHACFIEMKVEDLATGGLLAYWHHYKDVRVFQQHSVKYRLAYFSKYMWLQHLYVFTPQFILNPRLALTVMFWWITWTHTQACVHEWYHVRRKERFQHFGPVWFVWLSALEAMRFIDTQEHRKHHGHDLTSLPDVEQWSDMLIPVMPSFFEWYWPKLLKLYAQGKTHMVHMHTYFYILTAILGGGLVQLCISILVS